MYALLPPPGTQDAANQPGSSEDVIAQTISPLQVQWAAALPPVHDAPASQATLARLSEPELRSYASSLLWQFRSQVWSEEASRRQRCLEAAARAAVNGGGPATDECNDALGPDPGAEPWSVCQRRVSEAVEAVRGRNQPAMERLPALQQSLCPVQASSTQRCRDAVAADPGLDNSLL